LHTNKGGSELPHSKEHTGPWFWLRPGCSVLLTRKSFAVFGKDFSTDGKRFMILRVFVSSWWIVAGFTTKARRREESSAFLVAATLRCVHPWFCTVREIFRCGRIAKLLP